MMAVLFMRERAEAARILLLKHMALMESGITWLGQ
jgi:hypothetical protein